jgi:hypothetical protein
MLPVLTHLSAAGGRSSLVQTLSTVATSHQQGHEPFPQEVKNIEFYGQNKGHHPSLLSPRSQVRVLCGEHEIKIEIGAAAKLGGGCVFSAE